MKKIQVCTIDDLYKAEVKGFIRYKKNKMERVSPFSRKDRPKASGEDSGAWHTRTMARMRDLEESSLRYIIKDATEAADNLETIDPNHPKAGRYRDEAHYAAMELQRRREKGTKKAKIPQPGLGGVGDKGTWTISPEEATKIEAATGKKLPPNVKVDPSMSERTVVPGSVSKKTKYYDPSDYKVTLEVEHEDFGEDEVREIAIVDFHTYKGSKGGMYEPPEPPGIEDVVYAWASGPDEGRELTDVEERKYILKNKVGKRTIERSIESIFEEQLMQYLADRDEAAYDDYGDRKYHEMVEEGRGR